MSRVNLLEWRRKKLSQRSIYIMSNGVLLLILLIVGTCIIIDGLQKNIRELNALQELYQPLISQLSERIEQQQQGLQRLEQADRQRLQSERVRDEMDTYRLFFQWLTDRLPEYSWLTALTVGRTGWTITGKSLSLEEIEQFIHQLLSVEQVTALSLNDLKKEARHYEFRVSFSMSAEVRDNTANGK
ncbi:PilN domain-containing protein [Rosenbergiella nectarea]|uniref:PilN domain-containing protein n=1 Tax=Rosenbergiella nectarea TaxID=988801 RepID=UPI001F4EBAD4|nr:PilN domain-containing protein [Rosenbergiella nectarea]